MKNFKKYNEAIWMFQVNLLITCARLTITLFNSIQQYMTRREVIEGR